MVGEGGRGWEKVEEGWEKVGEDGRKWERGGRGWERVVEVRRGCVDGFDRVREDDRW